MDHVELNLKERLVGVYEKEFCIDNYIEKESCNLLGKNRTNETQNE